MNCLTLPTKERCFLRSRKLRKSQNFHCFLELHKRSFPKNFGLHKSPKNFRKSQSFHSFLELPMSPKSYQEKLELPESQMSRRNPSCLGFRSFLELHSFLGLHKKSFPTKLELHMNPKSFPKNLEFHKSQSFRNYLELLKSQRSY